MHKAQVMGSDEQITGWLSLWQQGDAHARERIFAVIQPELRQIAARLMRRERRDHTLEPNALVNELCVRLLGNRPLSYRDRAHFFAVASQAMRRILIDHARARVAAKRGGEQRRVPLSDVSGLHVLTPGEDLIALDAALATFETVDARAARVVELRFFGGLQEEEIAEALGVSLITVKRDWKAARAWLSSRLQS